MGILKSTGARDMTVWCYINTGVPFYTVFPMYVYIIVSFSLFTEAAPQELSAQNHAASLARLRKQVILHTDGERSYFCALHVSYCMVNMKSPLCSGDFHQPLEILECTVKTVEGACRPCTCPGRRGLHSRSPREGRRVQVP